MATDPIRLNLGAGPDPSAHLPGYLNLDIKTGSDIGSLQYEDGTVDEIRASHVLEHVPYYETFAVVKHWFAKLKPGGLLKIAVPDFDWCVRAYLDKSKSDHPIEQYILGGLTDEHDCHGAIFTYDKVEAILTTAGFGEIERWESHDRDCSSMEVSLNVQARKPSVDLTQLPQVAMAMSIPRLMWSDNVTSVFRTVGALGIRPLFGQGAFWSQCLERIMTQLVEEKEPPEYILTVDYDSFFEPSHVQRMYALAKRLDLDAVAPVQIKREANHALVVVDGPDGKSKNSCSREEAMREVMEVATAHFGCTLIRTAALAKMPHPWFWSAPNADGRWDEGRVDDDIYFWRKWKEHGFKVWQANRVKIGHIQRVVTWPNGHWGAVHQYLNDYTENGIPPAAR